MQNSLAQLDSQSPYSHASTTDESTAAATSALADRMERLGMGQAGATNAHANGPNVGNGAAATAASAGHSSLSSKAAGALIEDNDFDESLDELNRDLPPHACR